MSVKIFGRLVPRTFTNERKFQIFCDEAVFLPREMKKPIFKPWFREELYKKYGDKAFIVPELKLFPIINKNTGLVDPRLIQSAVIRLLRLCHIDYDRYSDWLEKAISIFHKYDCKKNVMITLVNDNNKEISLIDFLVKTLNKNIEI